MSGSREILFVVYIITEHLISFGSVFLRTQLHAKKSSYDKSFERIEFL